MYRPLQGTYEPILGLRVTNVGPADDQYGVSRDKYGVCTAVTNVGPDRTNTGSLATNIWPMDQFGVCLDQNAVSTNQYWTNVVSDGSLRSTMLQLGSTL